MTAGDGPRFVRLHADFLDDPVIAGLPAHAVGVWVGCLALAVERGCPDGLVELADVSRRWGAEGRRGFWTLVEAGRIEQLPGARWALRNYRRYQRGTTEEPADRRLVDVWPLLAQRRLRARAGEVRNVAAWRRKVADNARRDQWDEARRLCERWPGLSAADLAVCLDGDLGPLRFLTPARDEVDA